MAKCSFLPRGVFARSTFLVVIFAAVAGCALGAYPNPRGENAPFRFPTFDASGMRTTRTDSRVLTARLVYDERSTLRIGDDCVVPIKTVGGTFLLAAPTVSCRMGGEPITVVSLSGQAVTSRGHYQSFGVDFHAKDASGALVRYELRADDCEGGRSDCQ